MPKHENYVLDGASSFKALGICSGETQCGDCRKCPYIEFQETNMYDCVRRMTSDAYHLAQDRDRDKEIFNLKLRMAEQEKTIKNLYRQLTIEMGRKREL